MYACSDHEAREHQLVQMVLLPSTRASDHAWEQQLEEMGLQILREHEHESVNYKRERERVERGHANRA